MKKWLLPNPDIVYTSAEDLVNDFVRAKNLTGEAARRFLNPQFTDLYDPFLFKNMAAAVARVQTAIEKSEIICVHGDYDADGVCASIILEKTLRLCGARQVFVYLPHREEGYGFSPTGAERIIKEGAKLIITCDCGTTNVEAITLAKNQAIDTIITDHHLVLPETTLPPARAFLNPSDPNSGYPFKFLCGAGVAYKLAQALILTLTPNQNTDFLKWLLGIAAISTITDMVPLLDENRVIVALGLKALTSIQNLSADFLRQTHRLGLWYLLQQAGTSLEKITTGTIEWQIGPRLNAAGRMNHANGAYKLLITTEPTEAQKLAEDLNVANSERQKLVKQYAAEALAEIDSQHNRAPLYWLARPYWPEGLLGLIASAVKETTNKPTFIFTQKGESYQASARAPKGFNLAEVMNQFKQFFEKAGGHAQAAGCTILGQKNFLNAFQALSTLAAKTSWPEEELKIDAGVTLSFVNLKNALTLKKLAPYGVDQREPLLILKNIQLTSVRPIGKEGAHCQMTAQDVTWRFIQWQTKGIYPPLQTPLDIVFNLRVGVWQNQPQLEAIVVAWRAHLD